MDPKKFIVSLIVSGFAGQVIALLADIFPRFSTSIISLGMAFIGALNLYFSPEKKNSNETISSSGIFRALNASLKNETKNIDSK